MTGPEIAVLAISVPTMLGAMIFGVLGAVTHVYPMIRGSNDGGFVDQISLIAVLLFSLFLALFVALNVCLLLWKIIVPQATIEEAMSHYAQSGLVRESWIHRSISRYMSWVFGISSFFED